MPASIEWSRPALIDLRNIGSWLNDQASGEVALRTLSAIRRRATFLETHPHGGRPEADGLRVLLVRGTPYLIIYRIFADSVQVLRIRHEREDWQVVP
ncbi:type II toxin-antitoxin system RelE/ParE family toxin [Sphingomonas sp. BT553]|uniref:Type II toxin-antitoxin system RelE/ParE family toxin n=1 Tax=Sphingomonas mollis TaxID=2795726 RepID=A0ABS0XNV4_9SPHN|nr:type II toxin-antitoxin system RelE/ParE family toxin [Sphingomonas sp. BT553]